MLLFLLHRQEREELAKAWNLLDPVGAGTLNVNDPKLTLLFKELRPDVSIFKP